ncbi:RDD family protein [Actinotalea sp.]|uniref:RDD family protein n=1 Tax=Actinotalea sp. TaxID=1872145 RepID=UPI002C5248C6|nr:RDD family protein [Actinotalea sp.]HQY32357.1 RDD family protein [Actinotalea sp.]HRA49738.1 RDD family protein [Actinotalea sp.]
MSTPGAVPAAPGRRLLAAVVDAAAALVLGGGFVLAGSAVQLSAAADGSVTGGLSPLTVLGLVTLAVFGVVQWWYQGTRGFTVGSRLVGVRTLAARTGRPVGMRRIGRRMLVVALALAIPVVGPVALLVSVLTDRGGRRQGWHDKAAGTVVFDIGVGVDPATAQRTTAQDVGRRVDRLLAPPIALAARLTVPHGEPAPDAGPALGQVDVVPLAQPAEVREPVLVPDVPRAAAERRTRATEPVVIAAVPPARTGLPPESTDPRGPARASAGPDRTASGSAPERVVPVGAYESVGTAASQPLDDEVERTRLRSARSKVAYAPSRSTARPRATLLLWDNRLIVLDGTALVGRNPSPRAGEQLPVQVIAVVDRGRSVSKTHLAIGVDADGVWLRDRNSTNGTIVTLADGQQILCAPEQTVRVPVGASVAFGDYWLTVTG